MIKNKNVKKLVLVTLVLLLIASVGWFVLIRSKTSIPTSSDDSYIKPPSQAEIDESNRNKEGLADKNQDTDSQIDLPSQSVSSKKQVTPVISAWGQASAGSDMEFNGYVAGIIEKGGTCTITLASGGAKVTKSRESFDDAQNTSCGLIRVERNKLSAGTWQAVLSYESVKYSGSSDIVNVEVK